MGDDAWLRAAVRSTEIYLEALLVSTSIAMIPCELAAQISLAWVRSFGNGAPLR